MTDFTAPGFPDAAANLDPDLVDLTDAPEETFSLLDQVAADVKATTESTTPATTELVIRGRDGWTSVHRLNFTRHDLEQLRKKAKNKHYINGLDDALLAALILAFTSVELRINGDAVTDDDGRPVCYSSPALRAKLGTSGGVETVRAIYANADGPMIAASEKVIDAAGWTDEADQAGPTV